MNTDVANDAQLNETPKVEAPDIDQKYDISDQETSQNEVLSAECDDDEKGVDIKLFFSRTPKQHPGEYFKDQFVDKRHPNGDPSVIEFKWNPKFEEINQCDTIHMMYLLQCACDLHRLRVIERNKYFESISRTDRYIAHVDTPQIITNFIEWHNDDKEKNVFTGNMLESEKKMYIVAMISAIGMSCDFDR